MILLACRSGEVSGNRRTGPHVHLGDFQRQLSDATPERTLAQGIVAPGRGAGRTTRSSASRLTVRALLFALVLGTAPRSSQPSPQIRGTSSVRTTDTHQS